MSPYWSLVSALVGLEIITQLCWLDYRSDGRAPWNWRLILIVPLPYWRWLDRRPRLSSTELQAVINASLRKYSKRLGER